MTFEIGDRVRIVSMGEWNRPIIGSIGTVKGIFYSRLSGHEDYAVEFDDPNFDGNDCGGRIKSKRGWLCEKSRLELVEEASLQNIDTLREVIRYYQNHNMEVQNTWLHEARLVNEI